MSAILSAVFAGGQDNPQMILFFVIMQLAFMVDTDLIAQFGYLIHA